MGIQEAAGMGFEDLDYQVEANVATIAFNQPDKLNAARAGTYPELIAALDAADADDSVRAVIVTGRGRAFCAGTDLSGGFRLPKGGDPATGEGIPPDLGGTVTLRVFDMRKPVIGAINGPAVGFGATFLLPMDYRLASTTAKIGYVFARRGIVAESCSSWFLPRIVGIATALDWMLSGRIVEAPEALAKGLVSEVLPPEDLLPRATAIARELAENSAPGSMALNRQLLWRMLGADHPFEAHELESRAIAAALAMPDSTEGAKSFLEKRPPQFTGRVADTDFSKAWWPPVGPRRN
jgi:enoyl-CoA hydratase/carnithine racemase